MQIRKYFHLTGDEPDRGYTNCYGKSVQFVNELVAVIKVEFPELTDADIAVRFIDNRTDRRILILETDGKIVTNHAGWDVRPLPQVF